MAFRLIVCEVDPTPKKEIAVTFWGKNVESFF